MKSMPKNSETSFKMNRFIIKLKAVGIGDILHIFKLLLAVIPAFFLRKKRKNMWLVCEYENEARDNGYWFFKYVRENHPEQDAVYAVNKSSADYDKVKNLGEVVSYGTIKHWIYYLASEINISSQKGGKPNAAVCYLLEVYGILRNKRVFLQHGITKDLADLFFYENTKMRLFICGAKPEYDFVKEKFGYPDGYVAYTGFARFDYLLEDYPQKKQILVSPTWRLYLRSASSDPYKQDSNGKITESLYYKTWKSFLQNKKLQALCEEFGYDIKFFPHRNTAHCFDGIDGLGKRTVIANWEEYDLQLLMKESEIMLTDYTSSAMDFAYMKKPVIYYQFDYDEYRKGHLAEGYFDYERDGFGEVVRDEDSLIYCLERFMKGEEDFGAYEKRVDAFFPLRDSNNCKRIYEEVKKL